MKKLVLTISILSLLFALSVEAKRYYRFKNPTGSVEIKDKITKEMEAVGYDIIGDTGKVIKHVNATKTLAELAAERQRLVEEHLKEIAFQQQLKHDADLLRQFTSIGDIIRNRDSQLLALEQRIRIQNSKEDLLKLQLEDQQQQAATYERLGQAVATSLLNDIQASLDQIASNHLNTQFLETEKIRVEKSFEKDIIRFKELESVRIALRKTAREQEGMEPVIFLCPDLEVCNRAWQLAQIYARDNATGKIEIITNTLILTSKPEKSDDVAISFSKIPTPDSKMQIVLEVSCTQDEPGVAHCKTQEIKNIRLNYIDYLKSRMKKLLKNKS